MKILRVNMNTCSVTFEDFPEAWKIIGGRALTAKILESEVPPMTDPLAKEAKLIIAIGPLAGTLAPSCGRISVGAKSPLTMGIKEANAGGPSAQKLDRLGIRAIIIEGAPEGDTLSLLKISKDDVSLESADQYRGMRNYSLVEALHQQYHAKSSVISIGVVGERKLKSAAVDLTDKDGRTSRHAARGGLGAVMGAKGLKAIVIDDSDTTPVAISDKKKFQSTIKSWSKLLLNDVLIKNYSQYGSACASAMFRSLGSMPAYNYSNQAMEDVSTITGQGIDAINKKRGGKMDSCMPGCLVKCSVVFHDAEGNHVTSSYEYEATAMMGTNLGIVDPDAVAKFDRICDEIGIDVIECGSAIGVAASAGKLEMGDIDAVTNMLGEIENGTEFGNILANGVVATCKALGVERIPAYKGQAIPAHDPRVGKGTGVTYHTSPMGADHTAGLCYDPEFMSNDGAVEKSLKAQILMTVKDAVGYCYFATPQDHKATLEFLKDLINARYDMNIEAEDLIKIGREALKIEVKYNKGSEFHTIHDPDPEFVRNEPISSRNFVFKVDAKEIDAIWDHVDTVEVI